MFEFWLGGDHYEPIDLERAKVFEETFPPAPRAYAALRRCTQVAVDRMVGDGLERFVVFGAGIPATGNVHEVAGRSRRVLYSDLDPAAVELGSELVAAIEGVDYVTADAARPLASREVRSFIDAIADPVGFIYAGVTPFIDDDLLRRAVDGLFAVAPRGSALFLDFDGPGFAAYPAAVDIIRAHAPDYRWREPTTCTALFTPWRLDGGSVLDANTWIGVGPPPVTPDDVLTYVGYARKA